MKKWGYLLNGDQKAGIQICGSEAPPTEYQYVWFSLKGAYQLMVTDYG